jgi:hypothetical protein
MKWPNGADRARMPDSPVEHGGDAPYPSDMEARVRVLEEIAARQDRRLDDLFAELRAFRSEAFAELRAMRVSHQADFKDLRSEFNDLRSSQESEFRWLLGLILGLSGAGLALMAHGFHWWP